MKTQPPIRIEINKNRLYKFYPVLQQGVRIKTRTGWSIERFLTQEIGLAATYVDTRIKTIFLDGKPVDDIAAVSLADGATLALSGPMPGLVGATLRRGSFFASFRSTITQETSETAQPPQTGCIVIKLFNSLLKETGQLFLQKGIWLEKTILHDLCRELTKDTAIKINGATYDTPPNNLFEPNEKASPTHIHIIVEPF